MSLVVHNATSTEPNSSFVSHEPLGLKSQCNCCADAATCWQIRTPCATRTFLDLFIATCVCGKYCSMNAVPGIDSPFGK